MQYYGSQIFITFFFFFLTPLFLEKKKKKKIICKQNQRIALSVRKKTTITDRMLRSYDKSNEEEVSFEELEKLKQSKAGKKLLSHTFSEFIGYGNLLLSSICMYMFATSVTEPNLFTAVIFGIVGSELGHLVLIFQTLNLAYLKKTKGYMFSTAIGRFALLVNAYAYVKVMSSVYKVLSSRSVFSEALKKQANISTVAGNTTSRFSALIGLIPLFLVSRRGKTLTVKRNIPYADLSVVDPSLLKIWTATPLFIRNINQMSRGRMSNWLKLDVYCLPSIINKPANSKPSPVLIYIHGGAWTLLDKGISGLALINRVASRGVVVFAVNYRLSPDVLPPAHIQDCKRALIWVKQHCHEYGGDANNIFVSGESAGGHLSALMGATVNHLPLQPEEAKQADTSIRGCLPIYGVFDFSDKENAHKENALTLFDTQFGVKQVVSRIVMQQSYNSNPDIWHQYSPTWQLQRKIELVTKNNIVENVPPYLVCHGTLDSLAAYKDSVYFFNELKKFRQVTNENTVKDVHVEVDGGLHGFGYIPSARANAMGDSFVDFIFHYSV